MKGKWYYYVIFVVLVIIVGILYSQDVSSDLSEPVILEKIEITNTIEETNSTIYVYICGAVTTEGVYELVEGARVFEIIELAGGLTEEADTGVINQARMLSDGEMIYFPTIDEVQSGTFIKEEAIKNSLININTATEERLMQLPGIGQAKAKSIINYRNENSKFQAVEDIMNVSGIKEALFYSIKDFITVK